MCRYVCRYVFPCMFLSSFANLAAPTAFAVCLLLLLPILFRVLLLPLPLVLLFLLLLLLLFLLLPLLLLLQPLPLLLLLLLLLLLSAPLAQRATIAEVHMRTCAPGEKVTHSHTCEGCPVNSFSNRSNSQSCHACPHGSHTSTPASSLCSPCALGQVFHPVERCQWCPPDRYSVQAGEEVCHRCPVGAECRGGADVVPLNGFWRSPGNHSVTGLSLFLPCDQHTACEGAAWVDAVPLSFLATPHNRSGCAEGYRGNLCNACAQGYGRYGLAQCVGCENSSLDTVFLVLILCVLVLGMAALIWRAISTSATSKKGAVAMVKIGLSHLQVMHRHRHRHRRTDGHRHRYRHWHRHSPIFVPYPPSLCRCTGMLLLCCGIVLLLL